MVKSIPEQIENKNFKSVEVMMDIISSEMVDESSYDYGKTLDLVFTKKEKSFIENYFKKRSGKKHDCIVEFVELDNRKTQINVAYFTKFTRYEKFIYFTLGLN